MYLSLEIQEKHYNRYLLARRVAAVSAVFTLLVAMFMAADYYLLKTADPLDTPALNRLAEQLESDSQNQELRQQLRELDLLARKAFFTRQWQLRTGAFLLVGGSAIFILALQLMVFSRKRITDPQRCPGLDDPWSGTSRARRVIAGAGLLGLVAIVMIAGYNRQHLQVPTAADDLPAELDRIQERAAFSVHNDQAEPAERTLGWPPESYHQWPSFRGVGGSGKAQEATPPVEWDGATGRGVIWKSRIPRSGFSSPVVWNDHVFISGADSDKREVYSYSAATGELLWVADTEGVEDAPEILPEVREDTGYAAPSVATDGKRVVAIFGTGVIICLDFDGRRLWGKSLEVPDNHYGHSSSLIIYENTVFIQYDHFGGSKLKALDVESGERRWEKSRTADISWASPILFATEDRMQLVLNAAPSVDSYDPLTGEHWWSNESLRGEIGTSPVYADGRVFAANQYAQAVAIDVATGETIWTAGRLDLPDAASPAATDEYLFLPTSFGAFTCVDAEDGSIVWMHDFEEGGYGSPIIADDLIYWTTADGVTRIFRAAAEFELIAESELGERSVCTPALVGERIYIRGSDHLYCIGPE